MVVRKPRRSEKKREGDARRSRNSPLLKCAHRKLLAAHDDMMHLQAEERHCMRMLKKSIDQSAMRNEKRLERERQQDMREHAITAHSDLHLTPSMPISCSCTFVLLQAGGPDRMDTWPESDYRRFGSACENDCKTYMQASWPSGFRVNLIYNISRLGTHYLIPYSTESFGYLSFLPPLTVLAPLNFDAMAIINEEIGDIFLAPPRSILIRRFLSPKAT